MTYAVISTRAKRTRYFNVTGKPETWHPIDVTVEVHSLWETENQAKSVRNVLCSTRDQSVTFPLGENDNERHVGTVTVEITSYQVVEMVPGATLSHLDDLEAITKTGKG